MDSTICQGYVQLSMTNAMPAAIRVTGVISIEKPKVVRKQLKPLRKILAREDTREEDQKHKFYVVDVPGPASQYTCTDDTRIDETKLTKTYAEHHNPPKGLKVNSIKVLKW